MINWRPSVWLVAEEGKEDCAPEVWLDALQQVWRPIARQVYEPHRQVRQELEND